MRHLVLCHEGAPMAVDLFAGPLRRVILDHPDDDADLWTIWEVPPAGSMASSCDITEQFAETWAMELGHSPLPAFVRHATRAIDLPNPLGRIA